MYDSDGYAPCRYTLLKRQSGAIPPLDNNSGTDSQTLVVPLPGAEDRWQLLTDSSGLTGLADMMARASTMYTQYVVYYILQVGLWETR